MAAQHGTTAKRPGEGPSILITRLSAVGDCVLTMPLAAAVRDHFPGATLTWLVQRGPDQLIRLHPDVDRVISVSRGWLKRPSEVLAVRGELRQQRPQIVLDPQSLTKSCVAGWLSGAGRRIGFAPPRGREVAPWLNGIRVTATRRHLVEAQLQLLEPLGVQPPVQPEFRLRAPATATQTRDRFLKSQGIDRYAVVNPGAAWNSKRWPPERFGEVLRQLPAGGPRWLIAWGGAQEQGLARQIAQLSGGRALLLPPTSLVELLAFLEAADLMLSGDTGPLHMAAATGTPCLGLYGPTRPAECGPYGQTHRTLQAYYQEGTSRERRAADNIALRAISSRQVLEACLEMLSEHSDRRAA